MIDEEKLLDSIMDCVDISIDTKTNIVNMDFCRLMIKDTINFALIIPVVSVSLPDDDEIEKKAEYMQRPRNPKNDNKEEFIYGYMQGADWIINKYKPNER